MRRVIKKYMWAAQLAIVPIIALLLAVGVSGLVSAMVSSVTPYGGSGEGDAAPEDEAEAPPAPSLAYMRNIFNQALPEEPDAGEETPPETEDTGEDPEETAPDEETTAVVIPGDPVPTDMRVLLIGTQVASDARWSMAILKSFPEGGSVEQTVYVHIDDVIYRSGSTDPDGENDVAEARIYAIEGEAVYFYRLSKDDQREYIDFDAEKSDIIARAEQQEEPEESSQESEAEPTPAEPRVSRNDAAQGGSAPNTQAARGDVYDASRIQRIEGNTYGVPEDMAQAVRDNPRMLRDPRFGPQPRLTPRYQGREIAGFTLNNLAPNSIYSQLGLRNGDMIVSVNGEMVTKPQQAMELFDQLGPSTGVEVKIKRQGRIQSLTYQLQ